MPGDGRSRWETATEEAPRDHHDALHRRPAAAAAMTPKRPREPSRWPHWVYDSGEEADYRFSFANERTFLAWIRTALALIAGGVALDVIALSMPEVLQKALAALLILLGLLCAVAAWVRWALAERAMRRGDPLPAPRVTVVLSTLLAAVAVAIVVASF